jgi:hypothetical protein
VSRFWSTSNSRRKRVQGDRGGTRDRFFVGKASLRFVHGLRIPRSDNLPSFAVEIVEVLAPTSPFGIKPGGEGGCTPALAVVVSAILDALAPLGVHDITMPTTPFKVWQAIRDARGY